MNIHWWVLAADLAIFVAGFVVGWLVRRRRPERSHLF